MRCLCIKNDKPRLHHISYIEAVLLECQQIVYMNVWLLKAFPRCKVKVSGNLINLQKSIYIASFAVLLFDPLEKSFSFALNAINIYKNTTINKISLKIILLYSRCQ